MIKQGRKCPRGVKSLAYFILMALWDEHRYVSNFTKQTSNYGRIRS